MGASTPSLTLAPAGLAQFGTRSMYHLARVGVNYRFGWSDPVPVVARY
jgi:outer membrane immunogenic protein